MTRPAIRLLAAGALSTAALGLLAAPASGHVTVQPGTQVGGGFGAITFRVPTERDNAGTTRLEIVFPAEQPLAFLNVKPHPGWTYRVEKTKLATPLDVNGTKVDEVVGKITWTAGNAAAAIHPGEYDEFSVSGGFLPKSGQMVFKATQTYDSGEVVRWIEQAAPGAEEPEHPAPILKLTPRQADQAQLAAASTSANDRPSQSTVNLALGLSIAALFVSLAAGTLGGLALGQRRRT